jgi:XTP/dITP diphosphohydrolase
MFSYLFIDQDRWFCSKKLRFFSLFVPISGMPPTPLIIATRNAHKTAEIRAMLGDGYSVQDANDFADFPHVEETGCTFLENATLKAIAISKCVDGLVVSDDSGLEVDALDGAPGVWSSSYGGEEGNHAKNNAKLLNTLAGIPQDQRTARFVCVMVVAQKGEVLAHFRGTVDGSVVDSPQGAGGFGYDPLFVPTGYQATFAELGPDIKNQLSHRARALHAVVDWLQHHFSS